MEIFPSEYIHIGGDEAPRTRWEKCPLCQERIKKEHLTQIAFFAHERLIHLIVTVLFAVLEFLTLLMCMLFPGIGTVLLTFAVLVLLVPYIRHYYLLENEVQHMYEQYDRLQSLIDGKSFKM